MRCLVCDSTNLKEVSFDRSRHHIFVGFDCLNCGATLEAIYEFSYWEDAETGKAIY
jgi:transcription initiation factor IIE alpha subunit